MYIFVDPGKNTGWAEFNQEGNLTLQGTTHNFEEFVQWLMVHINSKTSLFITKVICEEFKLYPWKTKDQMWSEFETVQVIGALRADCIKFGVDFELVPARNKDMGFMYQGTKEPSHSNPLNHQMVATAHGVFWLQNKGIRKPQSR
jgi:hypothetical protein